MGISKANQGKQCDLSKYIWYVCMCVFMYVCMYVYMHVCMHVRMYVHTYVCM